MILSAVVCPHPPLLFRELTGAEDVAAGLRAACCEELAAATADDPDVVVVVGGADATGSWDPTLPPDVARFGTTGGAGDPAGRRGLPLSLGVAGRLLRETGWTGPVEMHAIAWDAPGVDVDALAQDLASRQERVLLLVVADGSARRGEKAPGHLDERAAGFDDTWVGALAAGDPAVLRGLDAALAGELLAAGRAALAVLGSAVLTDGRSPQPHLSLADDPFGVMYAVARWRFG